MDPADFMVPYTQFKDEFRSLFFPDDVNETDSCTRTVGNVYGPLLRELLKRSPRDRVSLLQKEKLLVSVYVGVDADSASADSSPNNEEDENGDDDDDYEKLWPTKPLRVTPFHPSFHSGGYPIVFLDAFLAILRVSERMNRLVSADDTPSDCATGDYDKMKIFVKELHTQTSRLKGELPELGMMMKQSVALYSPLYNNLPFSYATTLADFPPEEL